MQKTSLGVILSFTLAALTAQAQSNCVPSSSSLIGWWPGENNTEDVVGSNPGVYQGHTNYAIAKVGNGFNFDGIDDRVRIPASTSLNLGTQPGFTLEAWINPSDLAYGHPILEWNDDNANLPGLIFWVGHPATTTGYLSADLYDGNGDHIVETVPGSIVTNAWQHVALTYSKSNGIARLYINGVVAGQQNLGVVTVRNTGNLYIGARLGSIQPRFFQGIIDEPSIYNRDLSSNEIAAIYTAGSAGKCAATPTGPTFTQQPTDRSAGIGSATTFTGAVIGTPPLTYQWSFNGTNIDGATNATYSINSVQSTQAGLYSLSVTNLYGSATSSNAQLTVGNGPQFTQQPTNQTVNTGSSATFSATVTGTSPFAYQWRRNGLNITGATNSTYTITPVQTTHAGSYSLRATNIFGSATSSNATLFVSSATAPSITKSPTNRTVVVGSATTFTATVTGTSPLAYQWRFNGTNIAGATNSVYSIALVLTNHAGLYSLRVTNLAGSATSSNASLTVVPGIAPTLTQQAADRSVITGMPTTFTVTATGTAPLAYQWSLNGTNIVGATNQTFTVSSVHDSDAGLYGLNVTNPYGSASSSNALLTVLPPATNCVASSSGLIGWWPGENNANDVVGSNPGVFQNGTNYAPAEVNYGFNFDGIDDRVRIPASTSLDLGTQPGFTLEAWINPSDLAYGHPILEWNDDNADLPGLIFWVGHPATTTGYLSADLYDGYGDHIVETVPGSIVTNAWQHVALTYSKSNGIARLYINGVVAGQQNLGVVTVRNTGNLYIGARLGSIQPRFFKGIIDEPSIYNRDLSSNEIAAIYAAGSAGKCPPAPTAPIFTKQPIDQSLFAGWTATFSAAASGTSPLAYQWLFNGTNIDGATNMTYSLAAVQESQSGLYSVSVTNLYGSATSTNALLTVLPRSTNCVASPSDLIGWWPGENNADDIVGSNPGVFQGGANYAPAEVGSGFNFDGIDDHVTIPASTSLNLGTQPGFTLEAWINPSDLAYGHPILEWNDDNANFPGLIFWVGHPATTTGYLSADLYDGYGDHIVETVPGSIVTNVWQHVALTYDKADGIARLYINGVVAGQQNLGVVTVRNTGNLYIGARLGSIQPRFFKGIIDEPSIYNRALSSNEIAAVYSAGTAGKCAPAPTAPTLTKQPISQTVLAGWAVTFSSAASGTSPLAYQWQFNGTNIDGATNLTYSIAAVQESQSGNYSVSVTNLYGSATSTNALLTIPALSTNCATPASGLIGWWPGENNTDDVVGSNPGVYQGDTNYATAEVGNGFNFDGINDRVRIPASASLNLGTQPGFTLEAWINPSDLAYGHPILEWNDDDANLPGLIFWVGHPATTTGYLSVDLYDGYGDHIIQTVPGSIVTNAWQHVALTYDKTNGIARLYINGVVSSEQNLGVVTVRNTGNLYIGARLGSIQPRFFKGIIDEPSIYNRALSAYEIAAIHAAGATGKCMLPPTPPIFMRQATNRTVAAGEPTTFSATVAGTLPLRFQWRLNGTNIANATNASYSIASVQETQAGIYSVSVTNYFGSASSTNALQSVTAPSTNPAPIADASLTPGLVVSVNGSNATVTLDGSRSSHSASNDFTCSWFISGGNTPFATGTVASVTLPIGTNHLTLAVSDGTNSGNQDFTVEVISTAAAFDELRALVQFTGINQRAFVLLAALRSAENGGDEYHNRYIFTRLRAFQFWVDRLVQPAYPALASQLLQEAEAIIAGLGPLSNGVPNVVSISSFTFGASGRPHLTINGQSEKVYVVEVSNNATDWFPVGEATETSTGVFEFDDRSTQTGTHFYRVVAPE